MHPTILITGNIIMLKRPINIVRKKLLIHNSYGHVSFSSLIKERYKYMYLKQ